jgi:transposase
MIIIGADYHPAFQQIAVVDSETGELNELRLEHREGAEKFYRDLAAQGMKVRVGMEASGHARWFERLLTELHFELWIGDAAEIRSKRVREQKTDRQDAQLLLRLLLEDRFPRVWVPSWENRDLRQLLWHRHRMVQTRTRIMNQLQAVALNEGLRCKKRLWRETGREQLESFRLAPWASRRRRDLLELLDRLNPTIVELSQAIEQEVEKCPEAQRLRTHPGVGSLTALAFVLIIGRAERFQCGKQIASYLGLVPSEESSGDRLGERFTEEFTRNNLPCSRPRLPALPFLLRLALLHPPLVLSFHASSEMRAAPPTRPSLRATFHHVRQFLLDLHQASMP